MLRMAVNRVSGSFVWEVGLELGGGGVRAGSVWNCVSKSVLGVWVGLVLGTLGGELKNDLPTWPWPGGVLLPTGQFNLCWNARDRCLLPEHRSWGIADGMVVSPNGQNIDFRWHEEGFLSTRQKVWNTQELGRVSLQIRDIQL